MPVLESIEIHPGGPPRSSVIWLHGLGADGHDFEGLVPELRLPAELRARFVLPHAPIRPVTLNAGLRMRAWYDVYALGPEVKESGRLAEDEAGIRESQRAIEGLIEREVSTGIPPERIVLAGFSQGGAVALHTALRHPRRLAGALALSTYAPLVEKIPGEANAASSGLPVFMAHGLHDPLIPLEAGRRSAGLLRELGHEVRWKTYPMGHAVCEEEIRDISGWLQEILA